jgi:hypothetical protein
VTSLSEMLGAMPSRRRESAYRDRSLGREPKRCAAASGDYVRVARREIAATTDATTA